MDEQFRSNSQQKITNVILILLVLAVIYLLYDKFYNSTNKEGYITVPTGYMNGQGSDPTTANFVLVDSSGNLGTSDNLKPTDGTGVQTSSGSINVSNWSNPIRSDRSKGYIVNDNSSFKELMIVGSNVGNVSSGPDRRRIGLYDDVKINGNLSAANTIQSVTGKVGANQYVYLDNIGFAVSFITTTTGNYGSYWLTAKMGSFTATWNGLLSYTNTSYPLSSLSTQSTTITAGQNTNLGKDWKIFDNYNVVYIVHDKTNDRIYRINCYSDSWAQRNYITIERLFPLQL